MVGTTPTTLDISRAIEKLNSFKLLPIPWLIEIVKISKRPLDIPIPPPLTVCQKTYVTNKLQ